MGFRQGSNSVRFTFQKAGPEGTVGRGRVSRCGRGWQQFWPELGRWSSGDGNREAGSRRSFIKKGWVELLKVKGKLSEMTHGFLSWVGW